MSKGSSESYEGGFPPHIHSGITKDEMMVKTFLVMLIPAVVAVFAMGIQALYHIATAVLTSLSFHYLIFFLETARGTPTYRSPGSSLVAGLIVGLAMPIAGPIYATFVVAALSMVVFRWGQEKVFGEKRVNPAAAAKVLVLVGISLLFFLPEHLELGMIFHPHHFDWVNLLTAEGFQSSIAFYETETLSAAESLVFWKDHGWIGGGSGIAVLIAGLVAIPWVKIKWRIPTAVLLTVGALSVSMAVVTGGSVVDRIAFHVFTGSVIFMAFFMATEPQTSPLTEIGQYLFGVAVGLLTFLLQLVGVLGGSVIALVVLNLFTDRLDTLVWKKPFGHRGD